MATESEKHISLKLMVDEKSNRVVFAESDKDFVDILFSFLTMPMGSIVRLLSKQSQPATIGSFTSLYQGLVDFDTKYLWTEKCKTMLLHPKNSAETLVQKLKLNIDDTDTESTRYFMCHWCLGTKLTNFKDIRRCCGCLMIYEPCFKESVANVGAGLSGGVFMNADAMFIISDDLKVTPASNSSILTLLNDLGIRDIDTIHEETVNVGLEKIYRVLEFSLFSKSTLTDMFLRDKGCNASSTNSTLTDMFLRDQGCNFDRHVFARSRSIHIKNEVETSSNRRQMSVKLIVRKIDNKVLYAEAMEDFIDLLFSLLAVPLGSVVKLLGGHSSLQCIENLYKSVEDLNVERYFGSDHLKAMLVSPKLSPKYLCKNQLLEVEEVNDLPKVCTRTGSDRYLSFTGHCSPGYTLSCPDFVDPKSPAGNTDSINGYVKGPSGFMVTDDLTVTPLSSISRICLLKSFNVNISSLEERVISVGKEEALNILKASLISTSVLTEALTSLPRSQNIKSEILHIT